MARLKLTPVLPQHLPTGTEYTKAMEKAVLKTMQLAQKDYESTQRTWKGKAKFKLTEDRINGNYRVTTGTNNKRYGWIDEGTGIYGPKHQVIKPKRSKYFTFPVGGQLKTRPDIIGSEPGSPHTKWVRVQQIKGIPSRRFTIVIGKRRQVTLNQEVSHAIALVNRTQK